MRRYFRFAFICVTLVATPISSANGDPDYSKFESMEIPALDRRVRFRPADWDAEVRIKLLMNISDGRTSGAGGFEMWGTARASFVGATVAFSQEITGMSIHVPEEEDIRLDDTPLFRSKYVATFDGKVLSTDFMASEKLKMFSESDDGKLLDQLREESTSEAGVRAQVMANFGYLGRELGPGDAMAPAVTDKQFGTFLKGCGIRVGVPNFRALGEAYGAVIGRVVWKPEGGACKLEFDATKAVDAVSGRPVYLSMRMNFREDSEVHTYTGSSVYKYRDSGVVSPSVAESSPQPSMDACKKAAKNVSGISYPELSKASREQGQVLLRIRVGENGGVESVALVNSSGYPRLDEWAVAGAHSWRFDPLACADLSLLLPVDFHLPPEGNEEGARQAIAQRAEPSNSAQVDTQKSETSYLVGMDVGKGLSKIRAFLDLHVLEQATRETLNGDMKELGEAESVIARQQLSDRIQAGDSRASDADVKKYSYAVGMNLGSGLLKIKSELDLGIVFEAIGTVLAGRPTKFSEREARGIRERVTKRLKDKK